MRKNRSLAAWREGHTTIGGWLSIGNGYTAELMAGLGFDWLCVDMQHGLIDYQDLLAMLPAISTTDTTPIVRVPWNEASIIMKVLDAGAYGVIVPMVNNRADAERAVAACRYPPDGIRSFGPLRAGIYGGRGYGGQANSELACIPMVETAEALENLDEIVSTPGVDGILIGPSDLALALGLPPVGDTDAAPHAEAVKRILACCRKHGVAAGIFTGSAAYTRRYIDMGFQFISLGTDNGFLARAAIQDLKSVREALPEREQTGY